VAAEGSYQRLRVLESESAAESRFDGRLVVNLLQQLPRTYHPSQAAGGRHRGCAQIRRGSGSVRTISGTMRLHLELEERIARFKNVEACVVFQSGFAANAGTVSASSVRRTISSPTS